VERLLEWFGPRNYTTISVICCKVVRTGRKMELEVLGTFASAGISR